MPDNDATALLAEALDFFNDHPSFSLRRDPSRTSYELASRIDAYFRALRQPATPGELYRQALDMLPEISRNVLIAHQLDGLSYGDIAAQFGITTRDVEHHIADALSALAGALDPQ